MGSNYEELFRGCPEIISMERFRKICRISKRRAAWLLQSGLVPCVDNGRKTRRYQIRTADAVLFLRCCARYPERYAAPVGMFSSKAGSRPMAVRYDRDGFAAWLENAWEWAPDGMDAQLAARLTGYSKSAVAGWARAGKLEAARFGGRLHIAKCDLQAFLITRGFEIIQKSQRHQRMLAPFIIKEETE